MWKVACFLLNLIVFVILCMQDKDLKISDLESENRKMKVELEEFRTEATHLKNQQATIRRLEERTRQLEQQVTIFKLSCYAYLSLLMPFNSFHVILHFECWI